MEKDIILRNPSDLTVAWAQTILNKHHQNREVNDVKVVSVETGTTTRMRVAVDHNGPESFPRLWFVKFPSLNWRARLITALPQLLQTEVRFYKEIAHTLPVNRPCVLAGQSKPGKGATLVLTDVTEAGSIPGNPEDTLSPEQAELVVKQLAHFHAHFHNKINVNPHSYRWLAGSVRRLEDWLGSALAVPLMKRGLRLAADVVPPHCHPLALNYAKNRRKIMKFLNQGPQTLIHHDCHPGNLFWHQTFPGFLDWQLVRIGEGVSDIAYFLATALEPKIRRRHEASLLFCYYQVLQEQGGISMNFNQLLNRYRAHLVYPFEAMVVTLAVGGMMDKAINLELIRRSVIAMEELDSFEALPV